jgi:anti-sigma factor RsiW
MTEIFHPAADRLEAYVADSLDRADRVLVESHLLGCPGCQTAVEEWRALFAALDALPQLAPSAGFADHVMARVRKSRATAWQFGWQQQAARAGALAARVLPKTTFGWGLATAFLALPLLAGGALVAWLMTRSYLTPQTLWAFLTTTAVDGLQGVGRTAVGALLQTDVAAWITANAAGFLSTAGMTGVGALVASAGATIMLSIWILYRNLFRTPTRESHYVTYSF